jgi:hypothetical protein
MNDGLPLLAAALLWLALAVASALVSLFLQSFMYGWTHSLLRLWIRCVTAPLPDQKREARRLEFDDHLGCLREDPQIQRLPPAQVACRLLWDTLAAAPGDLAEVVAAISTRVQTRGIALASLSYAVVDDIGDLKIAVIRRDPEATEPPLRTGRLGFRIAMFVEIGSPTAAAGGTLVSLVAVLYDPSFFLSWQHLAVFVPTTLPAVAWMYLEIWAMRRGLRRLKKAH